MDARTVGIGQRAALMLGLGLGAAAPTLGASAAPLVGWINGADPDGCQRLLRGIEEVEGIALRDGDRLVVEDAECRVELSLPDGVRELTVEDSPFTVSEPADTLFTRLLARLAAHDLFAGAAEPTVRGPVRGLQAAMVAEPQTIVAARDEPLYLPLADGDSEYRYTIKPLLGEPLCSGEGAARVVVCPSPARAGHYSGEIEQTQPPDRLTFALGVLSVEDARARCPAIEKGVTDERASRYIASLDIAACGPEWRLEAYRQIAPWVETDALARRLVSALAQGALADKARTAESTASERESAR